jgi:hypothetical protein
MRFRSLRRCTRAAVRLLGWVVSGFLCIIFVLGCWLGFLSAVGMFRVFFLGSFVYFLYT